MEELQFEDDIAVSSHRLLHVHQEEQPEGVDVLLDGVGLVKLLPVEVVKLVHEVYAQLCEFKGQRHGERCTVWMF